MEKEVLQQETTRELRSEVVKGFGETDRLMNDLYRDLDLFLLAKDESDSEIASAYFNCAVHLLQKNIADIVQVVESTYQATRKSWGYTD